MHDGRQFDSTYVGHFVSDGNSLNLRRTTSIARRPPVSTKMSEPIAGIEETEAVAVAAEAEPVIDDGQDALDDQTPSQSVQLPPLSTLSLAPSPSRSTLKRLPIWARGTRAQPVRTRDVQSQSPDNNSQSQSHSPGISITNVVIGSRSTSVAQVSIQDWSSGRRPLPSTSNPRVRGIPPVLGEIRQLQRESQIQLSNAAQITREGIRIVNLVRSEISSAPSSGSTGQANASSAQVPPVPETQPPNTFQRRIRSRRSEVSLTATTNRATQGDRTTTFSRTPPLRTAASQPQLRRLSNKKREVSVPSPDRPSSARQGKSGAEEDGECCVCMNAPCDCVFYRCGHVCACLKCAKKFKKCPICRENVSDIIKIWRS
jgi:Zinc finger, C3HC4 type (RING finger)